MLSGLNRSLQARTAYVCTILAIVAATWEGAWAATLTPEVASLPDGTVAVAVSVRPGTGEQVAGLQFNLGLPGGAYTVQEVALGDAALQAGKEVAYGLRGDALTVLIAGFNQNGIGAGPVATVYLVPAVEDAADPDFALSNAVLSDPQGQAVPLTLLQPVKRTEPPAEADDPSAESTADARDSAQSPHESSSLADNARSRAVSDLALLEGGTPQAGEGSESGAAAGYLQASRSRTTSRSSNQPAAAHADGTDTTPAPSGGKALSSVAEGMQFPSSAGAARVSEHDVPNRAAVDPAGGSRGPVAARVAIAASPQAESARNDGALALPGERRYTWRNPALFVALLCGIFMVRAVRRRLFRKG